MEIVSVRVIKPFLNLQVGTELYFNSKTDKFEFKSRDEDSSADYKSIQEKFISMEPWLITENIDKYFEIVIAGEVLDKFPVELPPDEIEPMEKCDDVMSSHILIAKINAESAEKIAKIHAESAERIAKVNKPVDWGVHSDGFQGGF